MSTETATVATDFVNIGYIKDGQTLPLVITPGTDDRSVESLTKWINENKEWVNDKIIEHGAVLFRGFDIKTPQLFESVAKTIDPELKNNYLGTSPRNIQPNTEYVFSASELPGYYPIMQHCEMSFLPNPPRKLFFYCEVAPKEGGETPLTDFRKVYNDLDPKIRKEFEERGIRYVRNYNGPKNKKKFDLWKLKRWDEMFMTTDKAVVEKVCKENDLEVVWKDDDRLTLINTMPAIANHPITNEKVWFNHLQVFHKAAAAIEYSYINKRHKDLRSALYNLFTGLMSGVKDITTDTEEHAMNCTFSDGTPIPDEYVKHVEEVIWKHMTFYHWQLGDVVAIDNFSTAHGRMPYNSPRNIMVSWSSNN